MVDSVKLHEGVKIVVVPDQGNLLKSAGMDVFEACCLFNRADAAPQHRLQIFLVVGLLFRFLLFIMYPLFFRFLLIHSINETGK